MDNERLDYELPSYLTYLALITAVAVLVALVVQYSRRLLEKWRVGRLWRSLQGGSTGEVFNERMVAELPSAARRYLLHSIKPFTPLASSVQLRMEGAIRSNPEGEWTPLTAEEMLSVPNGFVWKAQVKQGYKRLSGADHYCDGVARVRFWLWGLIPVVTQEGPDTSKSAAGRLAMESLWLPSALLPQAGAKWEGVDQFTAKVTIQIGGEPTTITMTISSNGSLKRSVISRWGTTADGDAGYVPFTAEVREERAFGGYTIPSRIVAGWWVRSDLYFEFFQASVQDANFQ